MMEKTKLDQVFENQLYQLEIKPQAGTWKRIAQQLPPTAHNRTSHYWLSTWLVLGLLILPHPLQLETATSFADIKINESLAREDELAAGQKAGVWPADLIEQNAQPALGKAYQTSPKEIGENENVPPATRLPSANLPEQAGKKRIPIALDSLPSIGPKQLVPKGRQRSSVKIEVTIHPEAFLRPDSLQQAAPESKPRRIQLLLKQLKGMTLQEN